ncbi:phospholipase [Acidipila sp. EB88]|nr:phospholipase [Acidipila sp. EB88]
MVLLHGRGASAEDILGLGPALAAGFEARGAGEARKVMFAAPEAVGNTWYPQSFMAPIAQNEPYLSSAIGRIAALVAEIEAAGIARDRIVIAGFSQGACLSSEFVARHPARYAGVFAFTGGLVGPDGTDLHHAGELAGTPVLLSSGDPDPHVPWSRVVETGEQLTKMGAAVSMTRYPGRPHTVLPQEVAEARRLLGA